MLISMISRLEKTWLSVMLVLRCYGVTGSAVAEKHIKSNNHQILDVLDQISEDLSTFGVDPSGPIPHPRQQVNIPETRCPLSDSSK